MGSLAAFETPHDFSSWRFVTCRRLHFTNVCARPRTSLGVFLSHRLCSQSKKVRLGSASKRKFSSTNDLWECCRHRHKRQCVFSDLPRCCHLLVVFQIALNFNVAKIWLEVTRKRVIMSASGDDGADPELRKYAPKWSRERPAVT